MNEIDAEIVNPEEIRVRIAITLPLAAWDKLESALSAIGNTGADAALMAIRTTIIDLYDKVHKHIPKK